VGLGAIFQVPVGKIHWLLYGYVLRTVFKKSARDGKRQKAHYSEFEKCELHR